MNPKIKTVRIRYCQVDGCGYPYSDKHHVFPQREGGRKGPIAILCPNHHRYANIIQILVEQNLDLGEIARYANKHFDYQFNVSIVVPHIMTQMFYGAGIENANEAAIEYMKRMLEPDHDPMRAVEEVVELAYEKGWMK